MKLRKHNLFKFSFWRIGYKYSKGWSPKAIASLSSSEVWDRVFKDWYWKRV